MTTPALLLKRSEGLKEKWSERRGRLGGIKAEVDKRSLRRGGETRLKERKVGRGVAGVD